MTAEASVETLVRQDDRGIHLTGASVAILVTILIQVVGFAVLFGQVKEQANDVRFIKQLLVQRGIESFGDKQHSRGYRENMEDGQ